jgi:TetR/AcrR family transcriptional regulator
MPETQETSTRSIILDAALQLFSRKGFDAVGVQEIANSAGITKPSLYYYFKSKQGLLEAIVTEHGAEMLAVTRKAAGYYHNLVMNLTALLYDTLNFAHQNAAFYRLSHNLFSSAVETTGYITGSSLRREIVSIIENLFVEASQDHGNMKGRENVYAETFLGILETWAILSINGEKRGGKAGEMIDEQLQYRIIHNYMHGIFS